MKNVNKKELFIKLIPLFITLLSCIILVSYAYYKIKLEGQKTHFVSTDVISFTYKESEDKISITNMEPKSDTEGIKENYFEFNVASNLVKDISINYEISILKTSTTNSFEENDVKAYLTDGNDNALVNPILISNLGNSKKIANAKVIYNNSFMYNNSNEIQTHTYRLRVWLKSDINMSKYTVKQEIDDSKTNISLTGCTFKFKVNVSTVEQETGADTLIKLTNNQNDSGLYTITHPKDTTLQIGATESVTEYRYRGASPKNYVTFNNEVWRIIGVFPTDDGTGKIENRIKLIRNESIGDRKWDENTTNNWSISTLQKELNQTYYNSLTVEAIDMVESVKYYLGGKEPAWSDNYNVINDTPLQFYSYERKTSGSAYYYDLNPNNWIGKVGIMYVSDYGYASSNCENKKLHDGNSASNDLRACNDTNWLYNIKVDEWLLPQVATGKSATYRAYSTGGAGNLHVGVSYAIRPVLYLNSNIQIIGGSGTSTDMYQLSIKTKKPPLTDGALTLSNLTNNKDNSGLYTITHEKDSTLQIGATEDVLEYRYRGASPKNYVTFNNETWRIIGVFPTDDGTGKIENRIKIVRDQSIGNKYWNTKQVNSWTSSTLQTELSETYLNSLSSNSKSLVDKAKYYLGGYKTYTKTSVDMYSYERKIKNSTSNEFYYGTNPNSFVGNIGLMYVSDYGYASSNCENKKLYDFNDPANDLRGCNNTNWLYNIKANEWLLPQGAVTNNYAFLLYSDGRINTQYINQYIIAVRPVLYLKSSTKITGGSGTSTNPYTLGI